MEMPKSLGTTHVNSIHHYGLPSRELVVPDGHRRAGVYEIPISMGFENHPSVPVHKGGMKYSVDYTIKYSNRYGPLVYLRTSGNVFAFPVEDIQRNGLAMGWDDIGIEKWKATSETGGIEYVARPKFTELTVARYERLADPVVRKYVTDFHYHGPINELGEKLSRAENLRQAWNRYKQSRECIENDDHIAYLGVTSIEGVIYSIVRLKNGEVKLSIGTKADDALSREADMFGLTLEDMIKVKLGEEDKHDERKSYDKRILTIGQLIREERATKQEVLERYKRLAENETDSKQKEKYERSIRAIEHDIKTIDRYRHARGNEDANEEAMEYEEKSDLEKTIENEEAGNKAEAAEKNKEYSEREMSTDDVQEAEAAETVDGAPAE